MIIRYFGGKTRTCKQIAAVINKLNKYPGQDFLSPFVGGGWVESNIQNYTKHLNDKHHYLIEMYKALQQGWKPPENLSKDEYDYIKNHRNVNPALTGFVGFGCSFAGKWFGGYAKDNTDRNYCLNAHNSILKKMDTLKDSTFYCQDYKEFKPLNNVIYCDPPYEGTTQYDDNLLGRFDTEEFWDVMREWSSDNIVLVSEYVAPSDFICIWEQDVKLDIRDSNNEKKQRTEKLFVHESNQNESS